MRSLCFRAVYLSVRASAVKKFFTSWLVVWTVYIVRKCIICSLSDYLHSSVLTARRCASAGTSYDTVSVCLSVTSRSSIETDKRIELVFWHRGIFLPVIHLLPVLWDFVPNSGLRKFRHGISIVERAINLARERWTLRVTNWTVTGQLSWQYLRAPTLDHCS